MGEGAARGDPKRLTYEDLVEAVEFLKEKASKTDVEKIWHDYVKYREEKRNEDLRD